ncbi:glycosyltransferase family 1 protein [Oceanobacillus arenosus]|uniref:Glycosyltransferase family 1 protein n=1 Tax=Oceanobacillus arenosus TaxID=1229153 RepID=A0A3D8Q3I8_9BACI|nr:glycosyltransferase family 1 protein [Oceanobacillus arenosus]RDW22411.1 glycosyltransferase family 1 protein [Oceanobacillus arenosus]
MEPIRILQVVTIMNRGGLETMLMNYYRQMDRTKIQFDFMVHRDERGDYDEEIERLGGKTYRMPHIRPGNYKNYFTLLEEFFDSHTEYKVVHSHINENSSFVLKAAHKAGIPCRIAHSHCSGLGVDYKFPFRLYARFTMKNHPTNYLACSTKAGEWLFGKNVKKPREVTVFNNAINVNDFVYDSNVRKKIRAEFNAEDKLVLGHVGRFNKSKNHDFLLNIFKAVHNKQPNSMLVLVGDGDLRSSIEKKATRLGLKSHVLFLGVREDINELMQGFDLFIFPSLFEGLPVVLVEAQAAGLNCIIADSITSEVDITGRIKFLSLRESSDAWAQTILSSAYEHVNTSEMIRKTGYDISSMANWLSGYYMVHALNVVQAQEEVLS